MKWEVRELGQLVSITSGFAFNSKLFNNSGEGMPLIRVRDVGKPHSETFYSGSFSDEYIVKDGDLLVAMDGDFRISKWEGEKALLNQRVCRIEPIDGILDKGYLLYFLPKKLKEIEDKTPFATVKHLSVKQIKSLQIPLPPLTEQRRIASILDRADALRRKDRALLEQYERLGKAVFWELFGDVKKNTKNWPEIPLSKIADRITVGFVGPLVKQYSEGGILLLRSLNVKRNRIDLQDIKYVSKGFHQSIRKSSLQPGDVVSIRTGNAGVTAVIPPDISEANCADLIVLTPGKDLNPFYLAEFLNEKYGDQDNIQGLTGAIQKHFNIGAIKKELIPLPPIFLQEEFAKILKGVENQKKKSEVQATHSTALFNSLLHRAFRGEL